MNPMPRAIEASVGIALGSLIAKLIETVVVIVSQPLSNAVQTLALALGAGAAAMFGGAVATIASGRKGWGPACGPPSVLAVAMVRDPDISLPIWAWGAVIAAVAIGAWLGYVRFRG